MRTKEGVNDTLCFHLYTMAEQYLFAVHVCSPTDLSECFPFSTKERGSQRAEFFSRGCLSVLVSVQCVCERAHKKQKKGSVPERPFSIPSITTVVLFWEGKGKWIQWMN